MDMKRDECVELRCEEEKQPYKPAKMVKCDEKALGEAVTEVPGI